MSGAFFSLVTALAAQTSAPPPLVFTPPPPVLAYPAPPAPPPPPAPICKKARRAVLNQGSVSEDDYPDEAIRAEQEGTAVARFTVSKSGVPILCTIVQSSESASLDAVTCKFIGERFRFRPALDCKGKPVASEHVQRIRWKFPTLQEYLTGMPEKTMAEIDVDRSGTALNCRIIVPTGQRAQVANGREICDRLMSKPYPVRRDASGAATPYSHYVDFAFPDRP